MSSRLGQDKFGFWALAEAGCYLFPQNYCLLCFHWITVEVCPRASPPSLLPFLFRFYVLPLPRKADSPLSVKELGKTLLSESYMHPWVGSNFRSIRKGQSQRSGPKTGLNNGSPTKPWSLGATGTVQSQSPWCRPSFLPFFSLLNTWYFLHPSTWATQCFCEQNRQPSPLSKDKMPLPHCTLGTWWPHLIQAYQAVSVMHSITAQIHSLCRLWLENRLHHACQSASQVSHCRQTTAGQTAQLQRCWGLDAGQRGWPRYQPHPTALAKDWSRGCSVNLCAPFCPHPLSSSQHHTGRVAGPGPNPPVYSPSCVPESPRPTF